jgi:hypothetical protein
MTALHEIKPGSPIASWTSAQAKRQDVNAEIVVTLKVRGSLESPTKRAAFSWLSKRTRIAAGKPDSDYGSCRCQHSNAAAFVILRA